MRNKAAILLAAITLAAFAACTDPLAGDLGLYCPEDHFEIRIINDGTAMEITGYVGGRTDVRIPPYIRGLPVTAIGERAFAGASWVWSDDDGLTWVVKGHRISSVNIPDTVTHIGDWAFTYNQLTSVAIPNSVVSIGRDAFAGNQFTSIAIPSAITSIEPGAFADNQLVYVIIPNNVTYIGSQAFARNNIANVTISNSVMHIASLAFALNQLTYVVIPNSEVWVCGSAFDYPDVTVTIGIYHNITLLRTRKWPDVPVKPEPPSTVGIFGTPCVPTLIPGTLPPLRRHRLGAIFCPEFPLEALTLCAPTLSLTALPP